jgi:hypothetical protein
MPFELIDPGTRLSRAPWARSHCAVLRLQLAERHLTWPLFEQILGRIERLAWSST